MHLHHVCARPTHDGEHVVEEHAYEEDKKERLNLSQSHGTPFLDDSELVHAEGSFKLYVCVCVCAHPRLSAIEPTCCR